MSPEIRRRREFSNRISSPAPLQLYDLIDVDNLLRAYGWNHGHIDELQGVLTTIQESVREPSERKYFAMRHRDKVVGLVGMMPLGRDLASFVKNPREGRELVDIFVNDDFLERRIEERLEAKIERETQRQGAQYLLAVDSPFHSESLRDFFSRTFPVQFRDGHGAGPDGNIPVWRKLLISRTSGIVNA